MPTKVVMNDFSIPKEKMFERAKKSMESIDQGNTRSIHALKKRYGHMEEATPDFGILI